MGKKFKIGDIVRITGTDIIDTVNSVIGDNVFLKNNGYWSEKVCEPVTDKATIFLSELQNLLRKYDASFVDYDCYDVTFRLGKDVYISFRVKRDGDSVDADNLFELAEVEKY